MTIYCARDFSVEDIQTIRDLIAQDQRLQRSALSRKLCQLWGWTKPNGELKDMTCRVALLRMQADGLIELPPSRIGVVRKRAHFPSTCASDAQTPIRQPVHELPRVTLQVVSGKTTSLLWNEYVARYHYLGYAAMSGSQIRYNVFAGEQLVACISFCACAWKLKDRERFIGWSEQQRQKNLQLVINNARFLVLPWIQSKGLASKILALAARQLPKDWKHRYGFEPVLLETFVEYERHKGTCYKAANWVNVGRTAGRGKKSTSHKVLIPAKDIWLYPLRKNFSTLLCK
ncbi:MAG: DUF4338 domain-containing protein [Betaproteobacteria bacterium]|jgi:hypothetical protein|nr:DUF4338 domain-containing protein [Betaproteobacteria bacterium]